MSARTKELRELLEKATKGPWEQDEFKSVDDYGQYRAFSIVDAKGKAILDTCNSDVQCIHDDRGEGPDGPEGSRWDETGRQDTALIVAMRNALPALLGIAEAAERASGLLGYLSEYELQWFDEDRYPESSRTLENLRAALHPGEKT